MSPVTTSLDDLIGNTPLLALRGLAGDGHAALFAKLEWLNPSGSDKDRVVQHLLAEARASGQLPPRGTIIEPTSGNIAFALATQGVPKGYRVILIMPEAVPLARVQLLRALGAEVVLTPAVEGMPGAEARAAQLATTVDAPFLPRQFENPAAQRAYAPMAEELWRDMDGRLDVIVAAVSTGSTISGLGHRLHSLSEGRVQVVAVEPAASPVLSGGPAGRHRLLGMGPPFVPANFAARIVDEIVAVSQREVQTALLRLYRTTGLLSGPSGGAAIAAALRLALRPALSEARIVTVLPDSMERYAGLRFWEEARLLTPEVVE